MEIEKILLNTCLKKYKKNLAAILIFGSYNTGSFVQGISDIDLIILFKSPTINLEKEKNKLLASLSNIKLAIHHFRTLSDYKTHIYTKGSWSSWITVICGSKIIYSTPEFLKFKKELQEKPLPKNEQPRPKGRGIT